MKRVVQAGALLALLSIGTTWAAEPSQAELAKQAKLTRAQAEKIAVARVKGGTVQSAEIEQERGHLVWSFDITQPGTKNIREILVDAKTGKIVFSETETPAAQAKEAAAEAREAKKP